VGREEALRAQLAANSAVIEEGWEAKKELALVQDKLEQALSKRDELCKHLGKDPSVEFQETAQGTVQAMSMQYIKTLETRLETKTAQMAKLEEESAQRNKADVETAAQGADSSGAGGRAAVRAAVEARADARKLEQELQKARATLSEQAEKLRCLGSAGDGNNVGLSGTEKASYDNNNKSNPSNKNGSANTADGTTTDALHHQLKSRVYALSKEVAAVMRERDALREAMQRMGGEASASAVAAAAAAAVQQMPAGRSALGALGGGAAALTSDDEGGPAALASLAERSKVISPSSIFQTPRALRGGREGLVDAGTREASVMKLLQEREGKGREGNGKGAKGRKGTDWDSGVGSKADKESELVKLRKRLVMAEKARQEAVAKAAQQARAAQVSLAAQSKAAHTNYNEFQRVQGQAQALALKLQEREQLLGALGERAQSLQAENNALKAILEGGQR